MQEPDQGIVYYLYEHSAHPSAAESAVRQMYSSHSQALENTVKEGILVTRRLLSSEGIDVDFSLNWRPSVLVPETYREGHFTTAALPDSLVLTYIASSEVFEVTPGTLRTFPSGSDGAVATKWNSLIVAEKGAPLTFVEKQDPADHLPIFPGFRSSHICWLNAEHEWMICQKGYDGTSSTRGGRKLGDIPGEECSRLVLSIMSGTAFFTIDDDEDGILYLWEFL